MISDFPAALQPIIQTGYLEHEFQRGLTANLAFRQAADREVIPNGVGETVTRTRTGLLPKVTAPINVQGVSAQVATTVTTNPLLQTAAKLDDGLIPIIGAFEQYTLTLYEYGSTMDLNTRTSRVAIAPQFALHAYQLGDQAARSMDGLARDALYGGYLGGNTFVRTASTTTAVPIDDVRGFLTGPLNGTMMPVSGTNPLAVTIGAGVYSIISVAVDPTNVSATPGGMSGVLTLAAAVSAADGAAGNPVISAVAPVIVRPNGRATAAALTATDHFTMDALLDAVASLRNNNVPTIDGLYNVYLDASSHRQLFSDPNYRQLFQGATNSNETFRSGMIEAPFLGTRFVPTTEAPSWPHPTTPGLRIHAPIVAGQGALVEGTFEGMTNPDDGGTRSVDPEDMIIDGVRMITRPPLDRFSQVIAQTWQWIGGYTTPTDTTTNSSIIASATNAALKRAAIIQHV